MSAALAQLSALAAELRSGVTLAQRQGQMLSALQVRAHATAAGRGRRLSRGPPCTLHGGAPVH